LTYLVGRGAGVDSSSTQALYPHGSGRTRSEEHNLRARCHHNRSFLELVRLVAISPPQGRSQIAHAVGSARCNPSVYPHSRRKDARGQRARLHAGRGWRLLSDGPRLLGLCSALCHASSARIFCHASQSQHERVVHLLRIDRQKNRHHLRPGVAAQRLLCHATIPVALATDSIQGPRNRQDLGLSEQQLCLASADNCSTLQKPLAGRIVLQIDATLYTLLQILSESVFEKTELSSAFQGSALTTNNPEFANQLNLFGN